MRFKTGVKLLGIQPEMVAALPAISAAFRTFGREAVVTSAAEPEARHRRGSLHYSGLAIDLRIRHLSPEDAPRVADELRAALTQEFDVILESDHIHLEYQPKGVS
jgi:hypothetical protein